MIAMPAVFHPKKVLPFILILVSGTVFAQNDSTDIETQKLIIIKPYSPTVSDAVKLKQLPAKDADSAVAERKKITYDIYSVPVASTFTPEKGRATGIKRHRQPKPYDNYAALGVGNYTNVLAEFYSNLELSNKQTLTIGLEHHSSQGGIDGVDLDDKYYNTKIDLGYGQEARTFYWDARLGFHHQLYNWYGLPYDQFSSQAIEGLDVKHNYTGFSLGGDIKMKNGVFDKASLTYRHFGDDFNSSEDHIVLRPQFVFPVGKETIKAKLMADYLNGAFKDNENENNKYGFLNLGIAPSLNIVRDQFALNLGAELVYSSDIENNDSDVFIYPEVKASYRVAGDYFTLYAGAEGGLTQNTYHDYVQNNPYLAPQLQIVPTNKQYDLYVGGKGKFTDALSYDLRGSYTSEEHKALFFHNNVSSGVLPDTKPYHYGNSFGVTYDDVTTFSIYGELNYALNDDLHLGLNATYYNYSTDHESEPWNLPDIEAALNGDYQISKKWSVGADVFYVGERKDLFGFGDFTGPKPQKIDAYVDANLRVGFQVNDKLGFFLHGNNLFNDNYDRWIDYPVQGIQGMIGASYQF